MEISHFIEWLSTNPWIWLVGFLIGIIGVLLSIIFYFKSVRAKEPKYVMHSSNLIRDFTSVINQLEVLYAGKKNEISPAASCGVSER